MRLLKTESHLTNAEILQKFKAQTDYHSMLNWQIIYSVQKNPGKLAGDIAQLLGISKYKVYRVVENYNKYGPEFNLKNKWGGRRETSCHLTLNEEKELLEKIRNKAVKGYVLTASDIRQEVETKVGHKVSDDYIWDLFRRHNWKKKSPRPKHPKSDPQKQDEFKKNLKKTWQPLS